MNVVFIADSKYAMQCAVTMQSFLNTNEGKHKVYVISTGMGQQDIDNLQMMCNRRSSLFTYLKIDESLLEPYDGLSGWSKYTFMKLLIPSALPEDVKKVLYLDVDILVNGDLRPIYDGADSSVAVYGVEDVPVTKESKDRCGITSDSLYINSGVMVMNLEQWRERLMTFDLFSFISRMKGRNVAFINDQDVINVMFEGRIEKLPCCYNVTNIFWGGHTPMLPKFKKDWVEGRRNPLVVHFTNSRKPWLRDVSHPYKNKWIKVLCQTPYVDRVLEIKTWSLRRMVEDIKTGITLTIDFFRLRNTV